MELEHKPGGSAQDDAGVPPAGLSGLDALRLAYNAIDDDGAQTELFDVQGSNAVIRYRRLGFEESAAALASEGSLWERNAQFLIEACDEILVRCPETGQVEEAVPGQRVTFDLRPGESIPLHQALGEHEDNIRNSVLRLFQGSSRALLAHSKQVDSWMDTLRDRSQETFAKGS